MAIKLYVTQPDGSWTGEIITHYKVRSRAGTLPRGVLSSKAPPVQEEDKQLFINAAGDWSQIERPDVAIVIKQQTRFSRSRFFSLFTDDELALWGRAKTAAYTAVDPNALEDGLVALDVRLSVLPIIDFNNPKTLAGLEMLTHPTLSILTVERLAEVLTGQEPQPETET